MHELRAKLVALALEWEQAFGNAPSITTVLSEYDAAMLIGLTQLEYSDAMQGATSVQRGHDFKHNGIRYQIKGTRSSGKPGSKITKVPQATNFDWDRLIWITYNAKYEIQEAWLWEVDLYEAQFKALKRLSPLHMRAGKCLSTIVAV